MRYPRIKQRVLDAVPIGYWRDANDIARLARQPVKDAAGVLLILERCKLIEGRWTKRKKEYKKEHDIELSNVQ